MEIEQDVPIPEHGKSVNLNPFRSMAIGESFLVPAIDYPRWQSRATYWQDKARRARDPRTFTWRKIVVDDVASYRCWRIA